MIINLKELSNVLSQLSDLVAGDKSIPGILFDIGDKEIRVCYTDNSKVFSEKVEVETNESDIKGKIIFNYQALTRIIEACKPTGKIITDTIEFEFCENNVIKIKAEKKIPVITVNKTTEEEEATNKIVSVTEQTISWTASDGSPRVAVLTRGKYDLLLHYDEESIADKYQDDSQMKPLSDKEWELQSDNWDIAELKTLLSKLAIENGKVVYIAPSSQKAFVQNTSGVICIPVKSEIKHKIVQSTSVAKAISAVLGKIATEDGIIHTHMIDDETIVLSVADNSMAISLKNAKQENSNIIQLNNCLSKDFTKYMLNFNREVLQSCLYGAKTAGASDKATLTFESYTEEVQKNDGTTAEINKVKLLMSAKNTNSSTDNKYDVIADYVLDVENNIAGLSLNVTLDVVYQAVSRAETDYIAFDINVAENGSKMLRIAEIDLEKRAEVSQANQVTGSWSSEFMMENRSEILGYTTYFSVGNE